MSKLTGKQMHQQLGDLLGTIKSEVRALKKQRDSLESDKRKTLSARDESLQKLATIRANIVLNGHGSKLSGSDPVFREDVRMAFEKRDALKQELISRLEGSAVQNEAEASKRFRAAEDERLKCQEAYFAEMAADQAYQALDAEKEALELDMHKLLEKSRRINHECSLKKDTFLSDKYFGHLYRRGFGLPQYKGFLFFGWMDKWLANRINYTEALNDFLLLDEMPAYTKSLDEANRAKLTVMERECTQYIETLKAKHKLKEVEAVRSKAYEAMSSARDKIKGIKASLDEIERREDAAFTHIVNLISEHIAAIPHGDFVRKMRIEDGSASIHATIDEYLNSIDQHLRINLNIKEVEHHLEVAISKEKTASRNYDSFKHNGYHNTRREFDSNHFGNGFLLGYLTGAISSSSFISIVQQHSHVKPEPTSSYSSDSSIGKGSIFGSDSSRSSSWGSSDSFGGSSSWGSSDSFGGDSSRHRTTDSF